MLFTSSEPHGFVSTQGSMSATCPECVVSENVAWPKYVSRFPLVPSTNRPEKKISLKLNLQKVFVGAQQWCALYLWHELQSEALVRSQVKQRPNCPFVRFAVPLPNKTPHLPPIFRIEHRNGQRSGPRRQHSSAERPLFAWLLPIIWKNRLVPRNKSAHQDQVAVIIEVHAHNLQSL